MTKVASILAFIISLAAIALSATVYIRADVIADHAVERREKQMVNQLKPRIHAVYRDFDLALSTDEETPGTLDQLFAPMVRMVTNTSQEK